MAAPVTHIVFAQKLFSSYLKNKDRKAVIIGTSFPDIRYLGVIERSQTHYQDVSLDDLANLDSFVAGLKLHSLIDKVREEYLTQNGIYELVPKSPQIVVALKLLEDLLFYNQIRNWSEYLRFFDLILEDELAFNVPKEAILKWHQILQHYLATPPTQESIARFSESIGLDPSKIVEINKLVEQLKNNQQIKKIIFSFFNHFPS